MSELTLIVLMCIGMLVVGFPIFLYICVRLTVYGWLTAVQRFNQNYHKGKEKSNGNT